MCFRGNLRHCFNTLFTMTGLYLNIDYMLFGYTYKSFQIFKRLSRFTVMMSPIPIRIEVQSCTIRHSSVLYSCGLSFSMQHIYILLF